MNDMTRHAFRHSFHRFEACSEMCLRPMGARGIRSFATEGKIAVPPDNLRRHTQVTNTTQRPDSKRQNGMLITGEQLLICCPRQPSRHSLKTSARFQRQFIQWECRFVWKDSSEPEKLLNYSLANVCETRDAKDRDNAFWKATQAGRRGRTDLFGCRVHPYFNHSQRP
jgi:hypothetical protein